MYGIVSFAEVWSHIRSIIPFPFFDSSRVSHATSSSSHAAPPQDVEFFRENHEKGYIPMPNPMIITGVMRAA